MLTYNDYKKATSKYLTLNSKLLNKLKCVSILELAKEKKNLDYTYLKNLFDIKTNFELEELLFNLVSRELITGKVNAQNESISISSVKPRCNLIDMKKAEQLIDRLIDNLNDANEFLTNEENKIKEKTKELNGILRGSLQKAEGERQDTPCGLRTRRAGLEHRHCGHHVPRF